MIKKISTVLLSILLIFTFSACSNSITESTEKETVSATGKMKLFYLIMSNQLIMKRRKKHR